MTTTMIYPQTNVRISQLKNNLKSKMLYFYRTDVSEGTDVNKSRESRQCDFCHYWYFVDKCFMFQPDVCKGCHNVLMISMNLSDIAILNIHGVDYHDLTEKGGTL